MPLFVAGSWVPIQHNVAWAEAYLRTKWYPDSSSSLATIHTGRKLGAAVPLLGAAGFPSNTMWSGLRPTSLPSGVLIHPIVWPQYTNVTANKVVHIGGVFPYLSCRYVSIPPWRTKINRGNKRRKRLRESVAYSRRSSTSTSRDLSSKSRDLSWPPTSSSRGL